MVRRVLLKNIHLSVLILVLGLMASCVPSAGTNRTQTTTGTEETVGGDSDGTNNTGGVDRDIVLGLPLFLDDVVWHTNRQVAGILNINSDFNDTIYIRGSAVHNFLLSDFTKKNLDDSVSIVPNLSERFCAVITYPTSITNVPLRVFASPYTFITATTKDVGLKLHISNKTINQTNCGGEAHLEGSSNGSDIDNLIPISADVNNPTTGGSFLLPEVCPTCAQASTSLSVRLYRVDTFSIGTNTKVSRDELNLSDLSLKIDFTSSIVETTAQCTNASCRAEGKDCCVDGIQCADDGAERPETELAFQCLDHALNNPNDFSRCSPGFDLISYNNALIKYGQAYADSKTISDNHLRYPNFYFICASTTPGPVESNNDGPEDAAQDAEDRLNQLIVEFNCLEEGKKDSPEFNSNQVCPPTFDEAAYETTRLKVWKDCGCSANPFPTTTEDLRCPDFGLKAFRNTADVIERVECYTPPVEAENPPFQELDLSIPNRAAPHRFFANDGTEYEVIESIAGSNTIVQEGDDFSYQDESAKQGPQFGGAGADLSDQGFGMNSILGRMSLELNRALPAKVVNVEFDQFYIISAHNGFYTPCPQCVSDSWFPTFKSLPSSTKGLGVQANGYTTSRSTYSDNYSLGNYEDTIFGRACWVPPTMLPFSHKPKISAQTQRLERLKTQAALYQNGYQRDWYGFNQGALIGSFDGVSWFAVGKGRRIQAKSNKLYLAINAPFADLADPGTTSVSIVVDLGSNIASDFDFDPELEINHPAQNIAGSCQSYHQCNVDADCITQLGWEYSCLDVNELKSHWPQFTVDGDEKANSQLGNLNFSQILQGGLSGDNSKRCVYRGMGAVCKRNYNSLSSARPDLRKAFRCAPNFYCEEMTAGAFNENLVRSPNQLDVFFFGRETDVLGRPQNYIGANRSLDNEIQENLAHNMRIFSTDTSDFGLCRPGRSLDSTSDLDNHQERDARGRTDYISQIGSCNSELNGIARTKTCPLIDMDPNSENFLNVIDGTSTDQEEKLRQNMCGNESRFFNGDETKSTFEEIELEKLSSLFSLSVPGLAADACLRRAGQVCFTNLDCGPNRLHSEQAIFLSTDRFGGSEAEKSFWEESLICGQAAEKPTLQADDFFDYDLTQNRCCREIASDFTMYSKVNTSEIAPDIGIDANLDLDMSDHTANNPGGEKRYSRYNNLDLIATPDANYTTDANDDGVFDSNQYVLPEVQAGQVPAPFQWRTFQETGKLNCCGGGWVRKFSDGTSDWSSNLRQNYNTANFKCLNYQELMYKEKPADTTQKTYDSEKSKLCFTPDKDGCVQAPIIDDLGEGFDIIAPQARDGSEITMDTTPTDQTNPADVTLFREAPYIPIPAQNGEPFESEDASGFFSFFIGHNYITDKVAISLKLPIYVGGPGNINSIRVRYMHSGKSLNNPNIDSQLATLNTACEGEGSITDGFNAFKAAVVDGDGNPTNAGYCLQFINDEVILHVAADSEPNMYAEIDADAGELPWEWAGVQIKFNPLGTPTQEILNDDGPTNLTINGVGATTPTLGMEPGNSLYYLTKLGRFELMGIPQIFYEPLYCNDNRNNLVPGLINPEHATRSEFENDSNNFEFSPSDQRGLEKLYDPDFAGSDNAKLYSSGNNETRVVFQDEVQLNQVFSGHEFKCCAKLGSVVTSANRCCSGHAIEDSDGSQNPADAGKLTCKLPRNANLNVYFNRFVSSEGTIQDDPEDGLREDDFIPATGEPKTRTETYTKLAALASKHCDSGNFRQGASMGFYPAQPNTGFFGDVEDIDGTFYFSIVDSSQDFDGDNDTGFDYFIFGLRWDHHFYCD